MRGWCSTLRNGGGPPPGCRPRQVIVTGDSGAGGKSRGPTPADLARGTWRHSSSGLRGGWAADEPPGGRRAVQARPP